MKYSLLILSLFLILACGSEESETDTARISKVLPLSDEEKEAEEYKKQFSWGFINKKGKLVIEANFQDVGNFQEGLCAIKNNNLWGFINKKGTIVIQAKYKTVWAFKNGFARVLNNKNLIGFINKEGKEIIKPQYDNANDFVNDLAVIEENGKFNYINKSNKKLYLENFFYADDFRGNRAIVETEKGYGLITREEDFQIEPEYDELRWASNYGLIAFRKKGKWGIMKMDSTILLDAIFQDIGTFENGLAYVVKDDLYGLIGIDGKYTIEPKYAQIWYAQVGNWALVTTNGKYGFINSEGEVILPIEYDQVLRFQENRSAIMKNDSWAYINQNGQHVTGFEYSLAWSFNEGFARAISNQGEPIFINKTGQTELVIPFNDVRDFHDGLAKVKLHFTQKE